jgi:hypothetical protein
VQRTRRREAPPGRTSKDAAVRGRAQSHAMEPAARMAHLCLNSSLSSAFTLAPNHGAAPRHYSPSASIAARFFLEAALSKGWRGLARFSFAHVYSQP